MDPVNALSLFMETVLVTFSIPGNILIILVCYSHLRKTSTDLIIGFQAIIDLLAAVPSCYAVVMVSGYDHVDGTFCKVKQFSLRYVRYTSLFLMTAIALDRFRVVCRALDQRWSWKFRHIHLLIFFCNVLGFVISMPAFFMFVPAKLVSGIRCVRAVSQLPYFDEIYTICTTTLFFLSLLVSSALYFRIYQVVLTQNKVRAAMKQTPGRSQASTLITEASSSVPVTGQGELKTISGSESLNSANNCTKRPRIAWRKGSCDGVQEEIVGEAEKNPEGNETPTPEQQQKVNGTSESHTEVLPMQCRAGMEPPGVALHSSRTSSKPAEDDPRHTSKKQTQSKDRNAQQTTAMLLVITVIFFVSWLPGVVFTHIPSHTLRAFRVNVVNNIVVIVGYALRNVNHIVNVFVYTLMNRRFKQQSKVILKKILGRK